MKKEMIEKAREIVEEMELDSKYGYIGHIWDNGDDTGIELSGVCATNINSIMFPEYFGSHIAIICGDHAETGEDVGEIIIEDAVVEYIVA